MTSISENVYIDKLNAIVNEYNNTFYRTIKMKPVDVKDNAYTDFGKKLIIKILNSNLLIILEYQNTKTFLVKNILQIWLKRILKLKKSKTLFHGHMLLVILMMKILLEHFMKKNFKKQIKKNLEKVIQKKGDKVYVKWKGYDNSFNN